MTTTVRPESPIQLPPETTEAAARPLTALQHRAGRTIRRHFRRRTLGVLGLLASDVATLVGLWALFRTAMEGLAASSWSHALFGGEWAVATLSGLQLPAAVVVGLTASGAYDRGDRRRDTGRVLFGVVVATGLVLWQPAWTDGIRAVSLPFLVVVTIVATTLVVSRRMTDRFLAPIVPTTGRLERVLFVGDPHEPEARALERKLLDSGGIVSAGWVGRKGQPAKESSEAFFPTLIADRDPDTVVLCGHLPGDYFELVVENATAAGCRVLFPSRHGSFGSLQRGLVWYGGQPFIELVVPWLSARHLLIKRLIDIVGATIGLILLMPLFALVAVAIKLDSRGPVTFRQERVGLGGRIFRMWKFRTMRVGAEDEKVHVAHLNHTGDSRLFKIPDDPRVTTFGGWLRRWSLDELPQLWNVLTGDMSLVGPRPFFEGDLVSYQDHHFRRLRAKPGITGLWQVNGRSQVVDFEEVVRYDWEYIERWNLWLDFKILAKTLPVVARRRGAY